MSDVASIKEKRPDCTIYVYPEAGHGFHCDERAELPRRERQLGLGPHAQQFLKTHMS